MASPLERRNKIDRKINEKGSTMVRKARTFFNGLVQQTDPAVSFLCISFPDPRHRVNDFDEMGMANQKDSNPNIVLVKFGTDVREGDIVSLTAVPENEYRIVKKEAFALSNVVIMFKLRMVRERHNADV